MVSKQQSIIVHKDIIITKIKDTVQVLAIVITMEVFLILIVVFNVAVKEVLSWFQGSQ